jgi:hypothetical protein
VIAGTVNEAKRAAAAATGKAVDRARLAGVPDPGSVLEQLPVVQQFLADFTADTGRMAEDLESLVERLSARTGRAAPYT